MTRYAALVAATALCGASVPVAAQTGPGPQQAQQQGQQQGQQGVLVYPPEFFASAGPNTAFDMVQRVPGFALDIGNGAARGLAGAAGNVLIDGDRPSSKTDTLDQVLRRIAVASVERIELIRGGAPGIDMRGRPVIVNVVLRKTVTTELAAEGNVYAYTDGYLGPQAKLQYSRREGDSQTEGSIFATTDRTGGTAVGERVRTDITAATVQRARLDLWDRLRNVNARGVLQRRVGGGKLRINALGDFTSQEDSQDITITSGAGNASHNDSLSRTWSGELGLNWTKPLGPRSELELTGLQRAESSDFNSGSRSGGTASTFASDATSTESIVRGVWKFRPGARWSFESGGEIAYNVLDSDTGYAENGIAVPLPNAAVRVSELRGEVFGQMTWRSSAKLTIEAGIRGELSRIAQTGDTDQAKSFFYPKPRVQLTWLPANGHQVQLRVERQVGQLDFGDFVASTEVNLGTVAGGNADLVPQKDTVFQAVYERRFWTKGSLELTLSHRELQDVIDIIPLVGGFDAVGNIGKGTRDIGQLRLTLPLDRLGVRNALLSARGTWLRSHVTDPLTGERRPIAGDQRFGCGVSFNHDLKGGRFSYGFEHGCNVDRSTRYRVREVRTFETEPYVTLYSQWRPSKDLTVRIDLGNVTNAQSSNARAIYPGPRNLSPRLLDERRMTRQGEWLYLQVRKVL